MNSRNVARECSRHLRAGYIFSAKMNANLRNKNKEKMVIKLCLFGLFVSRTISRLHQLNPYL